MAYQRSGRPSWYFDARTHADGKVQFCTFTPDKGIAHEIEKMWDVLARRYRAWDLLDPVLATPKMIGPLYDRWCQSKRSIEVMRGLVADADLEPLVDEFHTFYLGQVSKCSADHAFGHVRHFFPAGVPRFAADCTVDWLTSTLAAYGGARNTRRKVHSSLSVWFEYLTTIKRRFAVSPMLMVPRPKLEIKPIQVYDAATVDRIVGWQPDEIRRAYFAMVYGTGADVSPSLLVERSDITEANHEVRIMGTKASGRDRTVCISDTMWPIFWAYASTVLVGRIWPADWNRWTVSDWHHQTITAGTKDTHGNVVDKGLNLTRKYPLRKSRHFFAVKLLQAGAPIRVVAEQLGSDEKTILKHYGPWLTSSEDRVKWSQAADREERRRRAGV